MLGYSDTSGKVGTNVYQKWQRTSKRSILITLPNSSGIGLWAIQMLRKTVYVVDSDLNRPYLLS